MFTISEICGCMLILAVCPSTPVGGGGYWYPQKFSKCGGWYHSLSWFCLMIVSVKYCSSKGSWMPYAANRDAVHPGPNCAPQSEVAKHDFGHYGSGFLVPFHSWYREWRVNLHCPSTILYIYILTGHASNRWYGNDKRAACFLVTIAKFRHGEPGSSWRAQICLLLMPGWDRCSDYLRCGPHSWWFTL